MNKLITLVVALVATFALIGCNTVDGIGKDFEDAGESMQEAAN